MANLRGFGKQLLQSALIVFLLFISNYSLAQDTDGDGFLNTIDIDDDNDGIQDAVESPSCFFNQDEWNNADKSVFATISSQLNTLAPNTNFSALTDNNGASAAVQFSTAVAQAQLNNELFKVTFSQPVQLDALYIKKTTATQIFAATAASIKLQGSNDNLAWTDLTAAIASPVDATNITANGGVSLTNSNKFTVSTNAGNYKYYRVYGVLAANILAGIASEFYFDVNSGAYISSYFPKTSCTVDTDNDGKLNHLDLDSDGDNCSDAIESGSSTTATSTTVYPTGADANANGLLNNYEGATAGTVNYYSTYANYAVTSVLNLCADTDSDGVQDLVDIDDDNDGVLDAVESPSCFFGANEWNTADKTLYTQISSQLNTLDPNTNFSALNDNVGDATGVVQFSTATAQEQLNKELFKVTFSRSLQLDALYIQKTTATQIFAATAASLKLQGSNDDVSWTDLTAAIAAPLNATNVTTNGAVSLTNSNKFTLLPMLDIPAILTTSFQFKLTM